MFGQIRLSLTWGRLGLLVICICAVPGCSREGGGGAEGTAGEAAAGVMAPDFSLPDLHGNTVRFSDFKGKVVLVDFWATWCGPCKLEVPHLVALHEAYKHREFTVIGIALDDGGAAVVEPFVGQNNVKYPVVIGNREVALAFGGLTAIPTAFLIDKTGRIVKKYVGYTEKTVFEEDIKKLL